MDLILTGEKTSTWRLFDDKDLSVDDVISLAVWGSGKEFAQARITDVVEKPLGSLDETDKSGHESFTSDKEMYATYSKYYDRSVGPRSVIKIVTFALLNKS